jgi:hypothetical protein
MLRYSTFILKIYKIVLHSTKIFVTCASLEDYQRIRKACMQIIQANSGFIGEIDQSTDTASDVVRQTMLRLPRWTQGILTWLTTYPLPHQNIKHTSLYQVFTAFSSLTIGVGMSILGLLLKANFYLLLFPGLLVTVSGMRKLQVVIYHHCSHGTVFHSRRLNFLLAEIISIILVVKDFKTYKKDHMAHHNSNKLLTMEDETFQDLAEIGIVPGLNKNILWLKLFLSFISPFAHLRWALNRIRLCFLSLNLVHNFIAIICWVMLICMIDYFDVWNEFIIAWLFPLTVLYHISRMLRLVAEHKWPTKEVMKNRGKIFICLSTVAVFNGEKVPDKTGKVILDLYNLGGWIARMIFVHLIARVFVLVGDTPCHDYHHRRPNSRDWPSYISARQKDKMSGCIEYPKNYSEVWGLFNAIDNNLQSISDCKA